MGLFDKFKRGKFEIKSFGKIAKEDIVEIEKKFDVVLPNDYKQFLLKYNGGAVAINELNEIHLDDINESSVLTIIFGSLGLMNIVSTDITLPIMFGFMGLIFLTNAKACYDNGAKKDAMIFVGVAIFVYVVTVYNLISRFM